MDDPDINSESDGLNVLVVCVRPLENGSHNTFLFPNNNRGLSWLDISGRLR